MNNNLVSEKFQQPKDYSARGVGFLEKTQHTGGRAVGYNMPVTWDKKSVFFNNDTSVNELLTFQNDTIPSNSKAMDSNLNTSDIEKLYSFSSGQAEIGQFLNNNEGLDKFLRDAAPQIDLIFGKHYEKRLSYFQSQEDEEDEGLSVDIITENLTLQEVIVREKLLYKELREKNPKDVRSKISFGAF